MTTESSWTDSWLWVLSPAGAGTCLSACRPPLTGGSTGICAEGLGEAAGVAKSHAIRNFGDGPPSCFEETAGVMQAEPRQVAGWSRAEAAAELRGEMRCRQMQLARARRSRRTFTPSSREDAIRGDFHPGCASAFPAVESDIVVNAAVRRVRLGRMLIAIGTAAGPAGAFLMDWNVTHVFNPAWSPHAKFHNAQTMALSVALGLQTLGELRSTSRPRRAAVLGATYWLTRLTSGLFPQTALRDPDHGVPPHIGSVPVDQRLISVICLLLIAAGAGLIKTQPPDCSMGTPVHLLTEERK